jgi:putative nucleotidyltransferase with HDIG domain
MDKPDMNNQSSEVLTPEQLVQRVAGLVSLPEVCTRVTEMVDDPRCSAAQIGKVIGRDAALTARLLKIVNSAFYQFPSRVETVSRAITIIGYRELRDLVFAATVSGMFERIGGDLVDIDAFWRHGIYCGILSRSIAKKCGVLHSERLFVAGLMHDIGKLIMSYNLPEQVREAQRIVADSQVPMYQAEQQVIGFDHAQVGAELMKSWQFPLSHQYVARFHHDMKAADDFNLETATVHLANVIAHIAEVGLEDERRLNAIDKEVWRITNVRKSDVETLLVEAREQFIEALTLFRPKGRYKASNAA